MAYRVSEFDQWCGDDGEDARPRLTVTQPSQLPTGRVLATLRQYPEMCDHRDPLVILDADGVAHAILPGMECPLGNPVRCAGLSDADAVSAVVAMLIELFYGARVEVL